MFALKLFILSAVLVAVSTEEPAKKKTAEIITEKTFVSQDGYDFEFKTSDGVSRQEEAHLYTVGDVQAIGVKGSYSYTAPDGQQYIVTYTADDKGFKPEIRLASDNKQ